MGLAWGEGAACPLPPKHTLQLSGCDVQFLRYFVCVCGAMALCVRGSICGYKHDWVPAASNKDTVAMGFNVRGTAMVDFHIHGRVEKKWFGLGLAVSVPDNESVKNSGLARLGSDRVGLATERWGIREIQPGGLGDIQRLLKHWLGLDPPKHTQHISGCDVQFLWHFCLCLWSDGTVCTWERLRLQTGLGASCVKKRYRCNGFRARNSDGGLSYTWSC